MDIKKALKKLKGLTAEIAVFAGSGLGDMIELEKPVKVSYKSLGFEYANIGGHERNLVFGTLAGKKVVLATRFHFYEDGSTDDIFDLYEILANIGVKTVISTTAVGGLNPNFEAGDIMLIKDHINLSGSNPLIGRMPIKFVDMTNAYDKALRETTKKIAKRLKINLWEGVHVQVMGPTYETPAEVKFYRMIGGDTVSMSSAYGNICANFHDMKFVGFASISNKAVDENSAPLSHTEVVEVAQKAAQKLGKIISKLIEVL